CIGHSATRINLDSIMRGRSVAAPRLRNPNALQRGLTPAPNTSDAAPRLEADPSLHHLSVRKCAARRDPGYARDDNLLLRAFDGEPAVGLVAAGGFFAAARFLAAAWFVAALNCFSAGASDFRALTLVRSSSGSLIGVSAMKAASARRGSFSK